MWVLGILVFGRGVGELFGPIRYGIHSRLEQVSELLTRIDEDEYNCQLVAQSGDCLVVELSIGLVHIALPSP